MKKIILSLTFICCVFTFAPSGFAQTKEATKFEDIDLSDCCEIWMVVSDYYIVELQKNPGYTPYVIYYGGKYHKYCDEKKRLPKKGEAEVFVSIIKRYYKFRGINTDEFIIVNGGYREALTLEFWIVPPSAKLPKLTSTVDKRQIKFGKGKPSRRKIFSSCVIG